MNVNFSPLSFLGTVHFSYFNDSHGKIENFPKFKTAIDTFEKQNKGDAFFNVSGGDINVDESPYNAVITKFMNLFLDVVATGNHDLEGGDSFALNIVENNPNFSWLAANLTYSKPTVLEDAIQPSVVLERNGEKVGFIGVAPFDYKDVAMINPHNDFISVDPLDVTVEKVRRGVEKLEAKGINQIVVLAHTGQESPKGEKYYEALAKIKGVDIIIGGHDHKQVNKWLETEAGEPVKVVSTGKTKKKPFGGNLDCFGVLDAEFDDNGVLIKEKTKNSFKDVDKYKPAYLGSLLKLKGRKNEHLATLDRPLVGTRPGLEENPAADLVCDAMLWYANQYTDGDKADFALTNYGSIRQNFNKKKVMSSDLDGILPFNLVQLLKTTLTKKQIMDVLEMGAISTDFERVCPGLIQVSGLSYEVDGDKQVKNVCIVDEEGKVLDTLDDMPDDAVFNVVYDTFLLRGADGLEPLKKDRDKEPVEVFDCSKKEALYQYLKNKKHIDRRYGARIITKPYDIQKFPKI